MFIILCNAGLVPEETEESNDGEASNEDSKLQDLPPCWGLDIVCGKGTDFNYGPWADRQRYDRDLQLPSPCPASLGKLSQVTMVCDCSDF